MPQFRKRARDLHQIALGAAPWASGKRLNAEQYPHQSARKGKHSIGKIRILVERVIEEDEQLQAKVD